jgi:DNA polymerase III sliding clamp (beta) subunit (PCNA family)
MGATAVKGAQAPAKHGRLTISQSEIGAALRRLKPLMRGNHFAAVARLVCDSAGEAWVEATNFFTAAKIDLVGEYDGELDALIEFAALERGVRAFNRLETLTVEQHDAGITMRSGVGVVELAEARTAQTPYPYDDMRWPEDGERLVHAHGVNFRYAVETAAVCASSDETRPVLTGIFCDARRGVLVGTDSYRLIETPLVGALGRWQLNLPARELVLATRGLGMDDGVMLCQERARPTIVYVRRSGECWRLRVIEGSYPNAESLKPDRFATQVVFDRDALWAFARSAAAAARTNDPMRIEVGKDVLRCSVRTTDATLADEIPARVKGAQQTAPFGLNPDFLRQILQALDNGSQHTMRLIAPGRPIVFECGDDYAMQMPIRLDTVKER